MDDSKKNIQLPSIIKDSNSSKRSIWDNDDPALKQLSRKPRSGKRRRSFPMGHWHSNGGLPDIHAHSPFRQKTFLKKEVKDVEYKTNGGFKSPIRFHRKGQQKFNFKSETKREKDITFPRIQSKSAKSSVSISTTSSEKSSDVSTDSSCKSMDSEETFDPKDDPRSWTNNNKYLNRNTNASVSASDNPPHRTLTSKSEELKTQLANVMTGDYATLPQSSSNIVRIFLSSTFSDTKEERNRLVKHAYPDLQKYCHDLGLDFQVVDMRWGVTDQVNNDHRTSDVCLEQIRLCKSISMGPNFVAFLGDRYGFRPFPSVIPEEEFEALQDIACKNNLENQDLLTLWFLKDENAVPSEYVLQPVKQVLNADKDAENAEESTLATWNTVFQKLQTIFKEATTIACEKGLLTKDRAHEYSSSVTEKEVREGLLSKPNAKALCYIRHLQGLKESRQKDNSFAPKFIDCKKSSAGFEIDEEAKSKLECLTEEVKGTLAKERCRNYKAKWTRMALNPTQEPENEHYLLDFCDDFVGDMKKMICYAVEENKNIEEFSSLATEVIHHAKFCQEKCATFQGREDFFDEIEAYVKCEEKNKCPLVIYAESGCGKTSCMAMLVSKCQQWIEPPCAVILRFLGTSPESGDIKNVISSIIFQMCEIYDLDRPTAGSMDTMIQTLKVFSEYLISVSIQNAPMKPLVILLDAIDQLSSNNGAYNMNWLPRYVPPNVYIIISTLPHEHMILSNIKNHLSDDSTYVEITELDDKTGETILQSTLDKHNRKLTKSQTDLVLEAFKSCRQPLYLKIVLDNALAFRSYMNITEDDFEGTARNAILDLFAKLEDKYGEVLIRHICVFLVIARIGISEVEMEDALSCSDMVLDEVYTYHDPPVPGIVRIPPLLWARVRYDLNEYLVERQAGGKRVVAWYHRIFKTTAMIKYLETGRLHVHFEEKRHGYNSIMTQIYSEQGVKRTITLSKRNLTIQGADRQIAPQPLTQSNHRKMVNFPYYLYNGGTLGVIKERLKQECLCNFKFLLTKLKGMSLQEVRRDLNRIKYLKDPEDQEIEIMKDFLGLAAASLRSNPENLAIEVVARLPAYAAKLPNIGLLFQEAKEWLFDQDDLILYPKYKCLPAPGGILSSTFEGPTDILGVYQGNYVTAFGPDSGLEVIDLRSGEVAFHFTDTQFKESLMISQDEQFVYYTQKTELLAWSVKTGTKVHQIDCIPEANKEAFDDTDKSKWLTAIAVSKDENLAAVTVNVQSLVEASDTCMLISLTEGKCLKTIPAMSFIQSTNTKFVLRDSALLCVGINTKASFGESRQACYFIDCKTAEKTSEIILEDPKSLALPGSLKVSSKEDYAMIRCKPPIVAIINLAEKKLHNTYKPTSQIHIQIVDAIFWYGKKSLILTYNIVTKLAELLFWDTDKESKTAEVIVSTDLGRPSYLSLSDDRVFAFYGYYFCGAIEVCCLPTRSIVITLKGAITNLINSCHYISVQKHLLTASTDGSLKVWNLRHVFAEKNIDPAALALEIGSRHSTDGHKSVKFIEQEPNLPKSDETEKDEFKDDVKDEKSDVETMPAGDTNEHKTTPKEEEPGSAADGDKGELSGSGLPSTYEQKAATMDLPKGEMARNKVDSIPRQTSRSSSVDPVELTGSRSSSVDPVELTGSRSSSVDPVESRGSRSSSVDPVELIGRYSPEEDLSEGENKTSESVEMSPRRHHRNKLRSGSPSRKSRHRRSESTSVDPFLEKFSDVDGRHFAGDAIDIEEFNEDVVDIAITKDDKFLISCYESKPPVVWDIKSAKIVKRLDAEGGSLSVHIVCDDRYVVGLTPLSKTPLLRESCDTTEEQTGREKYAVIVWDFDSGEGTVNPDVLADVIDKTQNSDQLVCIKNETTGTKLFTFDPKTFTVTSVYKTKYPIGCENVIILPELKRALTTTHRKELMLWNLESSEDTEDMGTVTAKCIRIMTTFDAISLTDDNKIIVGTTYGSLLKATFEDLEESTAKPNVKKGLTLIPKCHSREISATVMSKDRNYLVSASSDASCCMIDLEKNDIISRMEGHTDKVQCIALSSDNKLLASGSKDKSIKIWRSLDGKLQQTFDCNVDVFSLKWACQNSVLLALVHRYGSRRLLMFDVICSSEV